MGCSKILNSFLQDDQGVIPDWMKKGIQMTNNEKDILLEQLQKLKEILNAERKLTAERETLFASAKDALQTAEQKLEESVASFRQLRKNRKDKENVKDLIDSSNETFEKNMKYMTATKEKFGIQKQVATLVAAQTEKEEKQLETRKNA